MTGRMFVSHATDDAELVRPIVEYLRDHYIDTFYSPRDIAGGYWLERIQENLSECQWFAVLLSPAALESKWVREEVRFAMDDSRFRDRVLPILIESCEWKSIHPEIRRCQLFELTSNADEPRRRLVEFVGVPQIEHPNYQVGDVKIPVYLFVGGDGVTRFSDGKILCEGPGESRPYELPGDLAAIAASDDGPLEAKRRSAAEAGQVFVNNRQVRLDEVSWGGTTASGGLDNRPLRLRLGWTEYFRTFMSNMQTSLVLPDGRTVATAYQGPLDSMKDSQLSNPIAVNMSVVTSDNFIYYALRSQHVAWNVGGLQPAVSGDGQPEDVDGEGRYDPFETARRECQEEVSGLFVPAREQITFFGLARTMKTRFPFLLGEIRLPITASQLESYRPLNQWEGRRQRLPFTVEAVSDFVRQRYIDQLNRRATAAIGTTLLSLLVSLNYAFPERWHDVADRLAIDGTV